MRRTATLAIVLLITACGSRRPIDARRTTDASTDDELAREVSTIESPEVYWTSPPETPPAPPSRPVDPTPSACPASFADATNANGLVPSCVVGPDNSECTYPQGTCACARPSRRCSPVAPRPDDPERWFGTWVCERPGPKPAPPTTRSDGCPTQAVAGRSCTVAGKQCVYSDGCYMATFACRGGAWTVEREAHTK